MPLSPSPVAPGTSPLPEPGRRPPDTRAMRTGALLMLPVLLVALVAGPLGFPALWSVAGGFQAQINGGLQNTAGQQFQGFVFSWSASQSGGGYTTPASLTNLRSQASIFHMNAVIIPVIADMANRNTPDLVWVAGQPSDVDTLPESDYIQAIKDARKAGLLPILELQVRQYDQLSGGDTSADLVGKIWAGRPVESNFAGLGGNVGTLERGWFDQYAAFAAEYARVSAKYHLPYFIIGDDLSNVTTDEPNMTAKADPAGIDRGVPGESFPNCSARRDCEWRHVIHAIKSQIYDDFSHTENKGGSYSGKLIYAASWRGATEGESAPEFENITWWDAVDMIGVDAYFPLSQNSADLSVGQLQSDWLGQYPCGSKDLNVCPGDIVKRLGNVTLKYNHPLVFTSAGYGSVPAANSGPPIPPNADTSVQDQPEQLADMQALIAAFTTQPWWAGVFWNGDQPLTPRSQQQGWATGPAWAGDTLADSKQAGQWLASYYKTAPIACAC